ncbi:sulfatase family protein [Catenovulum sediminis]|uniref:Arylsulfatase n=1 Tax=Catenovulum sediminis TaxID=1740262 RepID=A0ABV1RM23_9ALTE
MKKIISHFYSVFCVLCLSACTYTQPITQADPQASTQATQKPNIIVILADDLGTGDVSFYNREILNKKPVVNTPSIDTLAENGIWFSNGHSATALCAPTRYAVMSGKNNYRSYAPWGVWNSFNKNAVTESDHTLGTVAKLGGYATGFVGKWHLGGDFALKDSSAIYRGTDDGEQPQVDLTKMLGGGPNNLGFDYSFMLPTGIQGPLYLAYENQSWYPLEAHSKIQYVNAQTAIEPKIVSDKGPGMGDSQWDTRKMGDILSAKAADFIKSSSKDGPFFLYYASPMVHIPHMPPESFDGKKIAGSTPSHHLDMVVELDMQINRLITALKEAGQYQNTLILLTSDNGGLLKKASIQAGHKTSGIYRGSKNLPYEGGHRTPYIASWPSKITSPIISDEAVVVQDLLATVAGAAGVKLNATEAPDSNDLTPLFTGEGEFHSRKQMFLQGGSFTQAIYIKGDWKLIIQSNRERTKFEPIALFNLKTNIRELEAQNLIKQQQARVQAMLKEYLSIRNAGIPTAPAYLN